MKNNLEYYIHKVNSHSHWKFKSLRVWFSKTFGESGWAGEGKFWAFNNIIAESDSCQLDLTNEIKKRIIAAELDFNFEDFEKFLKYITDEIHLAIEKNGIFTTKITQENFVKLDGLREYKREYKKEKEQERKLIDNKHQQSESRNNMKDTLQSRISTFDKKIEKNGKSRHQSKPNQTKLNKRDINTEEKSLSLSPKNPTTLEKKYNAFRKWTEDNAPSLFEFPEFINLKQYEDLLKKFHHAPGGMEYLQKKLLQMHNTKNAKNKYTSVYLTLQTWMDMDQSLEKNKTLTPKKQHGPNQS